MTVTSVLKEARQLITPKGKWTQEAVARDVRGNEVRPTDDHAKAFDIIGALQRVAKDPADYGDAIMAIRRQCGGVSIFDFNDSHGKKSVLHMLDRAIAEGAAA